MLRGQTIKCAFCQGTGENPHFTGSCPVCKGKGKNQIRGKVTSCRDCRGSGQKGGTTLTCYTCGGLGVVPDTWEVIKKAREEIQKARQEMHKERRELCKKIQSPKKTGETISESEDPEGRVEREGRLFCQCCANRVEKDSVIKVCLDCFRKIKIA